MLEQIAWSTFESTGNIETYILYRQIEEDQTQEDQTDKLERKSNDQLVFL